MKVLITGGAGFIGSHLAEYCLKKGDSVSVVDNLSTGRVKNLSTEVNFIPCDSLIHFWLRPNEFDQVYHLAANVGFLNVLDAPARKMFENIEMSNYIFERCKYDGVKVLFTSSSEVYGERFAVPFGEDDRSILGLPIEPRWGYAYSKLVSEYECLQSDVRGVVVRLFNTIGPRQVGYYGMVVPRFVDWIKKKETVQICGTGEQMRCFCSVHDVVEALWLLMNIKDTEGQIYNVGSNEGISIYDLMLMIHRLVGYSTIDYEFVPYWNMYGEGFKDVPMRIPLLIKVKEAVGWEPKISLEDTLKEIIESE